ncbi:MFS transporter [Microcella alkaliphila]|uniref:MFS transporter n=1 Tax=Microcella alkaliphila TaxID=279828 RepID=A0A4Q7TAD1_9MICO|nr:MFS transporter [Microcella alkaliphila]RZT57364.1 MFS transporter [Microcella alkaliphila]
MSARRVQGTFYVLTFGNTIAASFIWGINTLFLLDAGLSNLEAFAANAFFTLGMVIFEIPTGVVADTWGRRASYLLGTITLAVTTALYWFMWLWQSPFWTWALVSVLLGLGFTFFTGAVDAWLVDALQATGYRGGLETVFGRAQVVAGVSMLSGSVLGGVIAQLTNLGVPFLVRVGVLLAMVVVAGSLMRDLGFTPVRGAGPVTAVKTVMRASIDHGFRRPAIRWVMIATPFTAGVGIYAFYALQPYLLEVAGDSTAYALAGIAAAIFAGSSIVGGALAPVVRRAVRRRTTVLIASVAVSSAVLVAFFFVNQLWLAIVLLAGSLASRSAPAGSRCAPRSRSRGTPPGAAAAAAPRRASPSRSSSPSRSGAVGCLVPGRTPRSWLAPPRRSVRPGRSATSAARRCGCSSRPPPSGSLSAAGTQ